MVGQNTIHTPMWALDKKEFQSRSCVTLFHEANGQTPKEQLVGRWVPQLATFTYEKANKCPHFHL